MLAQALHRIRVQPQAGSGTVAANVGQQRIDQHRQVVEPLAQGRQRHPDHIEPVVQILPELALRHHLVQIAVGGADQAHIHRHFSGFADRAHPALLHGAQQLGLHRQRQFADFVEKQRPPLRRREKAGVIGRRPGERTLAITEKFGFEQMLGNGAAVHRNERARGARAALVHGARGQLLARTRFTVDQNRRHATRHPEQGLLDREHHRRLADHALQRRAERRLGRHRRGLHRGMHRATQRSQIDRLGEVIEGPRLERSDRIAGAAIGGDHDGLFAASRLRFEPVQQFQPLSVRQAHVGEHQRIVPLHEVRTGLREVLCNVDQPALAH
ncbi:hypothetical protein GALL_419930 [mine drainage metagenome]|uniref:Uncharacterized protein n=1 Tax=mine drainage metagenome TaxID=410659 RepID=A0A1J5PXV1_9ZZZZ